jgi:hypothetical protein
MRTAAIIRTIWSRVLSLKKTDVSEVCTDCIIRAMNGPDDGGSTYLWNVGLLQWDYTALYPRKLPVISLLAAVRTWDLTDTSCLSLLDQHCGRMSVFMIFYTKMACVWFRLECKISEVLPVEAKRQALETHWWWGGGGYRCAHSLTSIISR